MPKHPLKTFPKKLLITSPFWHAELDRLGNPTAIRMAEALDPGGPLGIGDTDDPFWKGFKHSLGEKDSNIDFLLRVKKKHPEKIVIVQVGEFYETWGIDSVFLVEYCGLNRMGRGGPRAGTPLANLQSILDRLTQAGFSVVVCEQAEDTNTSKRKTRFIAEIVTPSSPIYTYGLGMDKRRGDTSFPDCPPEFGIVFDKRGVTIVEVNPDLRTVLILEALTREAAKMRLMRYGGRLSRVFCHENVDQKFLEACHLHYENILRVAHYLPRDFPKRVEELLKIDLSLPADIPFARIQPQAPQKEIRPRPLYLSTAEQIGLLPAPGIPDLIDQLLPRGSPLTCQNVLRNFLLHPPPKSVADKIRKILKTLLTKEISFPEFPVANPARYVKTLHRKEASPEILKDLCHISQSFLACAENQFAAVLPDALAVVSHLVNVPAQEIVLKKKAQAILKILLPILPADEDTAYAPESELISPHLFNFIEDEFRGRVAETSTPEIARLYAKVNKAAAQYAKALITELLPLVERRLEQKKQQKSLKPLALSFDIHNRTIWLRGQVNSMEQEKHKLTHPCDRYGKTVRDRWTTDKVESALQDYKESAEEARNAVAALLKDLSEKLAVHNLSIVHLATFSNLLRTFLLHAQEGQSKKWGLTVRSAAENKSRLTIKDFFPYWMSQHEGVKNSLSLQGVAILTGHNMAGKSTVLRSSAVVTLLASAGFLFPASEVHLPEVIDGWFVRTGTHDDPESGLSAFAVEIKDLKTALRDASPNSLLLIDELGKGTESKAGHAIAGSVLEYLQAQKIKSIFATHWHELFYNPQIDLDSLQKVQMEIKNNQPTYRVIEGACLDSWAFETALELGLDPKLIDRARTIAKGYQVKPEQPKNKKMYPLLSNKKAEKLSEPHANYGSYSLNSAKEVLSEVSGIDLKDIRTLKSSSRPFLKDEKASVVYVLRTKQGFFYVGESDGIAARLQDHWQEKGKKGSEVIYVCVGKGKSVARRLESKLITRLQALGFPMLSVEDRR